MKNSIVKIGFLVALMTLTLSSCKKKPLYPTDQLPANVPTSPSWDNTIGAWGKFVVIDAVMYVDDKDAGTHTVYNHFSPTKSRSSLRYGGTSMFDIETIIQDTTTYSFYKPATWPGTGKFVLNDDTTKYYLVQYSNNFRSIIEDPTHNQSNLGGSSRPFSGQTINVADSTIAVEIEEMEGSDGNGHNIHYWTQLKLKKIQSW